MNDDQMDEMLIQAARDYNAPGAVPKEELWNRIQAERRSRRAAVVERPSRVWLWPSVGVAAALILSVGIVIGSRIDRTIPNSPSPVAVAPVTNNAPTDSVKSATTRDSLINQLQQETKKTGARVQELASAPTGPTTGPSNPNPRSPDVNQSLAYRLVVLQHLAGTEAMITSFRSGARSGEIDAQIATWSRELLSTTRLLEASQAASDPVMKRLLEDLDLVISQIVQYTGRGTLDTEELDLIEQSINKRGVMSKLRSNSGRGITAGT